MTSTEIIAALNPMTLDQLRKVWTAARLDLGLTTGAARSQFQPDVGQPPASICFEIVWFAYRAAVVFTKTGNRVPFAAHTSGGSSRMIDETIADEAPAVAAVARILAAGVC